MSDWSKVTRPIPVPNEWTKPFWDAARRGVLLQIGNNVGYFGPHEGELRGYGLETIHYQGCGAGKDVIGIEADGRLDTAEVRKDRNE